MTGAQRDEQLLALEHRVTLNLSEVQDAGVALATLMQMVCDSEGWECCRYLALDERENVIRRAANWSRGAAEVVPFLDMYKDATYAPGVGLAGRAWQSGQPVWAVDCQNDTRVANPDLAAQGGMRAALAFPVIAPGQTLGVLIFNDRRVRAPDARLQAAMRVIGSQAGQFLQRMRIEAQQRELG